MPGLRLGLSFGLVPSPGLGLGLGPSPGFRPGLTIVQQQQRGSRGRCDAQLPMGSK